MKHVLDSHEKRISTLESHWDKVDSRLISIENTVLKEGNRQAERQEELLDKLVNHHFSFKESRWGFYAKAWGTGGVFATLLYFLLERVFN